MENYIINYIIILSLIVTFFTLIVLVCHWIYYPHEYSKFSNTSIRFNPTMTAHGLIGLGLLFGTLYILSFNLYLGSVICFLILFFDLLWFRKIIKNKSK